MKVFIASSVALAIYLGTSATAVPDDIDIGSAIQEGPSHVHCPTLVAHLPGQNFLP